VAARSFGDVMSNLNVGFSFNNYANSTVSMTYVQNIDNRATTQYDLIKMSSIFNAPAKMFYPDYLIASSNVQAPNIYATQSVSAPVINASTSMSAPVINGSTLNISTINANAINVDANVYVSGSNFMNTMSTGIAYIDDATMRNFTTLSDRRLKNSIVPVSHAMDKLTKLQPVTYEWNSCATLNPAYPEMGFIAQDVMEVVPNLVSYKNDVYSVAYDKLTVLLTAAVKELNDRMIALEKN
jgi:hypothetical protein